jgi:hypothetical protein
VAKKRTPVPLTVAVDPAIVTVGETIASLAVIVSVIVSPAFALVVSALLSDAIVTDGSVGGVRSIVTPAPLVNTVTGVPALPDTSANATDTLAAEPSELAT